MAEAKKAAAAAAETTTIEANDFDKLLEGSFKPKSDDARNLIKGAVQTLAAQALESTKLISSDTVKSIEAIIAEIDKKLSAQVDAILHAEEFQKLEGTWRGLHHLVSRSETDEMMKIKVLNISKKDLSKTLKQFKGMRWDQSPLFKKVYGEEYDVLGGNPFSCLVGDYAFDNSAPDVDILQGMSQIAAAAHAPFIAGADPSLMSMESWQELSNPAQLERLVSTPAHAAWKALRKSDDARYLGLAMPRFLARLPYSQKNNPVEEFAFDEKVEGGDHSKYTWSNAAYAMAANITRSHKLYGWCARIRGVESGGTVEDLPSHTFPSDDGGLDTKCPTEIAIGDRREMELAKAGLMALCHRKGSNQATFISAQSLHQPDEFDDADATANANLGARLPYLFASCRFAHYLKVMVRDKVGGFAERADMEKFLSRWIMNYVEPDPANATEEQKARRPLAGAEVVVEEDKKNPGFYNSKFFLRPHYQLEGLNVSLRLVSKLPKDRVGG